MKIVNQTAEASEQKNLDLYVYGEIVDEKWWESDVDSSDFRSAFEQLEKGDVLNVYMNSGGGSVFTAVAICSIIERLQNKGITVNGYIDGLSASACTFIAMACDNLTAYPASIMMIHKPMAMAMGNADELLKTVETLNAIEQNTMMPLYEKKAKASMDEIRSMINAETWLSADEMSDVFDITISESNEKMVAMDKSGFKNYVNIPEELQKEEEPEETEVEQPEENPEETPEETPAEEPEEETEEEKQPEETESDPEETPAEEPEEETEEEPEKKKETAVDYSAYEIRLKNVKELF